MWDSDGVSTSIRYLTLQMLHSDKHTQHTHRPAKSVASQFSQNKAMNYILLISHVTLTQEFNSTTG